MFTENLSEENEDMKIFGLLLLVSLTVRCRSTMYPRHFEGASQYECKAEYCVLKEGKISFGKNLQCVSRKKVKDEWYCRIQNEREEIYIPESQLSDAPVRIPVRVRRIEGADFYADAGLKEKTGHLEFQESAEILEEIWNSEKHIKTYKIIKNNMIWHINGGDFDLPGKKGFFKVSVLSGLNLREKPDQNSSILTVVPYSYEGAVLDRDGRIFEIQGKKGYWFFTEYEKKRGWMFSGHVFLSEKKDFSSDLGDPLAAFHQTFLNPEIINPKVYKKYPEISDEVKYDQLLKYRNSESASDISGFSFMTQTPVVRNECNEYETRLILQNRAGNIQYFLNPENLSESVLKERGRFILTEYAGCWCCCGNFGENIYVVMKNKLQKYSFLKEAFAVRSECSLHPEKMRYSKNKDSLYLLFRYAECTMEGSTGMRKFLRFKDTLFIAVKTDGEKLQLKRVFHQEIPNEFKSDWDSSEKLKGE